MKKLTAWILLAALLLCACGAQPEQTEATELLVACFECAEKFAAGQINTDFGLCQDCLMKLGAAYCKSCGSPCFTRDMTRGRCRECIEEQQTTEATETTAETTRETTAPTGPTAVTAEAVTDPERVRCRYCGYQVRLDYMIGDYCVGCYSIRQGKCLRCTHNSRYTNGCHCEYCTNNWFYCASCDKRTPGREMFLDVCMDCYWKINSVLVPCPLCGACYTPSEMTGGYCESCYLQTVYHELEARTCDNCGREFDTPDELYQDGLCFGCYHELHNLCISCSKRNSDGMGPSGMECAQCYYETYAPCRRCGYDYPKDEMYNGFCRSCGMDPFEGSYRAEYENVTITISYENRQHYLTYTDLSSGVTLSNIPLASGGVDDSSEMWLSFWIDDYYPQYSGYVQLGIYIGARARYVYSAEIEGLEDTGGEYAPITKQ